ncbi:MarR family winged helix-turn-helix transcriptional regulator [Porphyrobacter sp. CACIAM 03H1]|uniref:MarR family winged helix-turn-helix transcriptional regulator n=1 Tax=Porphyrobacter sp. CACIAM 03H1 TaxID=2003315 RepID=UPI000B5A9604|nr:MarR family transcriptional regulator [Porphyrobacter sp. CACIAM 03H1]ASJ91531.1 transcriptional regulator [Porphyrobacter sp. CACIAM 03H1]
MSIETGYRLADNSRQLRRLFDERVRGLGITGPQARLLLSLERHPDQNQAFYAERLEIEPITLTRIVDRLEDAGWVERQADPADRRARILHLTDKSRGIVTRLRVGVEGLFEDMLAGFDAGERALFAAMLERIALNLAAARQPEAVDG